MNHSQASLPLLRRLASASWCHPGFAPYWPLLRRLQRLALESAGVRGAAGVPVPVGLTDAGLAARQDAAQEAAHEDDDPATWDAAHWLAPMNRLAAWRGLRSARGLPLRFVSGSDVGAVDYERSILESGRIPCKPHALGARHDFHNALVWLRFPRLKAAINWLHCQQADRDAAQAAHAPGLDGRRLVAAHGSAGAGLEGAAAPGASSGHGGRQGRGPLRDALTLLDENGALWPASAPEWVRLLETRQWQALFVEHRPALIHAPVIVGHGLLEKLHRPYKSMTAKLLPCPEPRHGLDRGTAERLRVLAGLQELRPALLLPLPVQGWPGWDPANADPAFYADDRIFRPLRPVATGR